MFKTSPLVSTALALAFSCGLGTAAAQNGEESVKVTPLGGMALQNGE